MNENGFGVCHVHTHARPTALCMMMTTIAAAPSNDVVDCCALDVVVFIFWKCRQLFGSQQDWIENDVERVSEWERLVYSEKYEEKKKKECCEA